MKEKIRSRIGLIIAIFIITPAGFFIKFYHGPGQNWVANSFSGVLYEIFWILLIKLLFPKFENFKISSGVFIVTAMLEFLQLYHHPFLEFIRQNFIGRTLIGNSFSWTDFPYYIAGCTIGYILLQKFHPSSLRKT